MRASDPVHVPVLIFGGGVAGLWLLDELARAGRESVLLEAHALGRGQTVASQGIIHGGLKYTLDGLLTPSARAIREMPLHWRRCLAGERQPDLSSTRLRAEFCHLWQTRSIKSTLGMIGARAGLRVGPQRLSVDERPPGLGGCPGTVARLDEQVVEPTSLLSVLADKHPNRLLQIDASSGMEFESPAPGQIDLIRLLNPRTGAPLDIRAGMIVFAAGAGNATLLDKAGLAASTMQRRPLHMVQARGDLPLINGHCVDGMKTRATITATRDYADRVIWQIGGQIAERGVTRPADELITHAISELQAILPSVNLKGHEWSTYTVDRAEAATDSGARPDDVFVERTGNVIAAWPTKMALVPIMVSAVLAELAADQRPRVKGSPIDADDWPRPGVAIPPWEEIEQWTTVD